MATKAKGVIEEIHEIKEYGKGNLYLGLKIKLDAAEGKFFFYILEYPDQPRPFKLITKHFRNHDNFKVGDRINFDYRMVDNGILQKRRIESIYNKGI